MKTAAQKESGFSLVSVLVIMGVVLAAILLISQARVNHDTTQKALKIKQSYADVNQVLINDLVEYLHNAIDTVPNCLSFTPIDARPLQGSSTYSFTQNLTVSSQAPQSHRDASNRCRAPRRPGSTNNAADNRFYFCLQINPDPSAARDSILNAQVAFAEIAVELIDLQTQQSISCSEYKTKRIDPNDGSAGMAVTMALYWEGRTGNRSTFSQKALSYIANQN